MSDLRATVFERFPVLETERLCLRETRRDDAGAVFAALSSEEVCRYYNLSPLTMLDEATALIAGRAAAFVRHERIRWVLARQEDDGVIGSCGLVNWNEEAGQAEIGYELAPAWQGQGLMREALAAVLAFGFGQMQLQQVEANVVPENEPSRRLLRRLGFREVELRRGHGVWKGQSHDLLRYLLHREDRHE